MDALKDAWKKLLKTKKTGYIEYRSAQKEMREIVSVKANIDYLFGIAVQEKNKEMER